MFQKVWKKNIFGNFWEKNRTKSKNRTNWNRTNRGIPVDLVLFVNRTKSKTALIETALTGESLYNSTQWVILDTIENSLLTKLALIGIA